MNLKNIFGRVRRRGDAKSRCSTTPSSSSTASSSLVCRHPNVGYPKRTAGRNARSGDRIVSLPASINGLQTVARPEIVDPKLPRPIETPISKELPKASEYASAATGVDARTGSLEAGGGPAAGRRVSAEETVASITSSSSSGGNSSEDESEWKLRKEEEVAVLKAWSKDQQLKKLAIPTDYPDYMREAPQLRYAETETSQRRREFIAQKIKSYESQPFKREHKLLQPGPRPKANRTSSLRQTFIGRQPILSQRFESHFSQFSRPPFRLTNVRLVG